jgi:hypothetical protein
MPEDQHKPEKDELDALNECWALCNTMANLSSIHREMTFKCSGKSDAHKKAWKYCWRLCHNLYDSRYADDEWRVKPTLDLCRDFCQALFDVLQIQNEATDNVLRASFEVNNQLYSADSGNISEASREGILDCYITLCHCLTKLRNELPEETNALLHACWGLAEMLFTLLRSKREGKATDEKLLGSAVQACWGLCDLFREGWTQLQIERGNSRPSQKTITQTSGQISSSSQAMKGSLASFLENTGHPENARSRYSPETPMTEFEDTPVFPEEISPNIPNILVLSTEGNQAAIAGWSSTTSTLSSHS